MEDAAAGAGISLAGLTKSFRSPQGPVHAVRGIDVSIPRGETVALLGPNGAGKSTTIDMLLGLSPPDARHRLACSARRPREAVDAGLIGAMLQTGALIHYLSVRELLTMMASLYPRPLDVDEVMDAGRPRATSRDQRTQKLSGRRDPARALRDRAGQQSRPAGARRADRGDGRRVPPRVLGRDARRSPRAARPCSSPPTTSRRPTERRSRRC